MDKSELFTDYELDIDELIQSPEDNAFDALKERAKRKDGKGHFNLFFALYKMSEKDIPDGRITTIKKLSQMTGMHKKRLGENIDLWHAMGFIYISTIRGKGDRNEHKIVVRPRKDWKKETVDKVISIYNWNKERWQ